MVTEMTGILCQFLEIFSNSLGGKFQFCQLYQLSGRFDYTFSGSVSSLVNELQFN